MSRSEPTHASARGLVDDVELFSEFLRKRNLKLTSQREAILQGAEQIKKHFSAEELFDRLRAEDQGISKATVYRTLSLLVEAELLEEHDFERGHKVYEYSVREPHHDHLICMECGYVLEFENEEIERLQDKVARSFGFSLVRHKLELYGMCPKARGIRGGSCPHDEAIERGDDHIPMADGTKPAEELIEEAHS